LEDALVNDGATLELLREVFFDQEPPLPNFIPHFLINVTTDSTAAINCSVCSPWNTCEPAFHPVTSKSNTSTALVDLTWILPGADVDAVQVIQVEFVVCILEHPQPAG